MDVGVDVDVDVDALPTVSAGWYTAVEHDLARSGRGHSTRSTKCVSQVRESHFWFIWSLGALLQRQQVEVGIGVDIIVTVLLVNNVRWGCGG